MFDKSRTLCSVNDLIGNKRRCLRTSFLALAVTLFAVFNFRLPLLKMIRCSASTAQERVNELCDLYKRGEVTGDLCAAMRDRDQIQMTACTAFHTQKTVVLMNCTDVCQEGKTVAAALKAELLGDIPGIVRSVEELYRPGDNTRHFWQKMNNNILTRVKRFTSYVPLDDSPVLTKTFGLHRWGQVDCEPGHHDPSDAPSVAQANAVWRSLALLLRQREFVFGTLFAQKQVFPRIYGTCGPYYLQESCSSDQIHNEYSVREVFFGDTPIPWSTRATAALKVLQFLKHMHSQLPENLVLIDVQAGQFGVCADGRARVTDCDEARFKYNFGSSATVSGADLAGVLAGHRNSSSCETDLDCSVLVDDEHGNVCRTFCDVERKACFLHEGCTLQRVCFSVFRGWRALLRMADAGLLRHPPDSVAEELELAIQECERVTDTAKYDPEEWKFILERLVQLLRRSLA